MGSEGSLASPAPAPSGDATAAPAALASAAQRTIAVVGDAWTLRILRTVFRGKRRYGDFVQEFGVSRAVLSDRLSKLVAHGVLERHGPDGRHPEYRLTERGLDLWSLFLAMWLWETDWGTAIDPDTWAPDLPRARVAHSSCGHVMRPQLLCLHCHAPVSPFETWSEREPVQHQGTQASAMAAAPAFRRVRPSATANDERSRPAQRLVRVVGDRWNCAVVAAAFRGIRLFSTFEEELGISPAQLSARLTELQQLGILRGRAYAGARQEYRLTKAGIALFPITLEMVRWGNSWLWPDGAALTVRHLPCAQVLQARWHCGHCAQELAREAVRFS